MVVAVSVCGICGSDLHTYVHGSFVAPGQIMGHEFAARSSRPATRSAASQWATA